MKFQSCTRGFILLFLFSLSLGSSACKSDASPERNNDPEPYRGTILRRIKSGKIESQLSEVDFQLQTDLASNGKNLNGEARRHVITVRVSGEEPLTLSVAFSHNGAVKMLAPEGLLEGPVELSREGEHCFFSLPSSTPFVTYFQDDTNLKLEMNGADGRGILSLSAVRRDPQSALTEIVDHLTSFDFFVAREGESFHAPILESPVAMTLSSAIDIALSKNLNSRMEFERLLQAKDNAKAAALNLLPHLSFSTGLAFHACGPITFLGVLGSIGDLAPFLLPTRWFQAQNTRIGIGVEKDAQTIMQADLANQIESLAYALDNDQQTSDTYTNLISRTQSARDAVMALETSGKMLLGSADTVQTMLDSMLLDQSGLKGLILADKEALAQAMGFLNPNAVLMVSIGLEMTPIGQGVPILDPELWGQAAVNRSFELQQTDKLIEMAKVQNQGIPFSWLDPAGAPGSELGFGLGATLAIGRSQVRQLELQRDQQMATILQKVAGAIEIYNAAIASFPLAKQAFSLQEKRLSRIVSQIVPDSGLSTMDVEAILQDFLANASRVQGLQLQFRIARANLDRLLLQGYYLKLQPSAAAGPGETPMG